jgi:hypothetical protein
VNVYGEILSRIKPDQTPEESLLLFELARQASVFFKPIKVEYFPSSELSVIVCGEFAEATVSSRQNRFSARVRVINDALCPRRVDIEFTLGFNHGRDTSKMFSWECRDAVRDFAKYFIREAENEQRFTY